MRKEFIARVIKFIQNYNARLNLIFSFRFDYSRVTNSYQESTRTSKFHNKHSRVICINVTSKRSDTIELRNVMWILRFHLVKINSERDFLKSYR